MESVYLETTFISYLVTHPSRDLQVAAHQQMTHEWWSDRRDQFDCYVSQIVADEASVGDPRESAKRMKVIDDLQFLDLTEDSEMLTEAILSTGALPKQADRDAAHIAVATAHEMDYLLTWNCRHLANAQIMRRISALCEEAGFRMPLICTPEELMGE